MFGLSTVTWRLRIQGTPTCRPEAMKEIRESFVRLGERVTDILRRLEEWPGFPLQNSMNNPGARWDLTGAKPTGAARNRQS